MEDIGLDYNPNATPIIRGAGHLGHGRAHQRGGATEDGAQSSELLGVQGSANADEVDRVGACEAGEKGGTELLHCGHVVRRKLADGLQIAMALAGVLWRGNMD